MRRRRAADAPPILLRLELPVLLRVLLLLILVLPLQCAHAAAVLPGLLLGPLQDVPKPSAATGSSKRALSGTPFRMGRHVSDRRPSGGFSRWNRKAAALGIATAVGIPVGISS